MVQLICYTRKDNIHLHLKRKMSFDGSLCSKTIKVSILKHFEVIFESIWFVCRDGYI